MEEAVADEAALEEALTDANFVVGAGHFQKK